MKLRTIKLCSKAQDKATGLSGTVTHWECDMGLKIMYLFQPRGLSLKDGQPVDKVFLESERLEIKEDCWESSDVPTDILGSTVTDKASGFTGMAVAFIKHPNGCFHVVIQPKGVLKGTNSRIKATDFDLRQCEGRKIPVLNEKSLEESKKKTPSPTGHSHSERDISTSSPRRE